MPTKNPRLNLTFEPDTIATLIELSEMEHKPVATIAKELVLEALDRREDRILSSIAEKREETTEGSVSHEDAWK